MCACGMTKNSSIKCSSINITNNYENLLLITDDQNSSAVTDYKNLLVIINEVCLLAKIY